MHVCILYLTARSLSHVNLTAQVMPLGATGKVKKGSKENTNSDLAHVLGYTGSDMDIGIPPSPAGGQKEAAGTVEALPVALLSKKQITAIITAMKLQVKRVAALVAL